MWLGAPVTVLAYSDGGVERSQIGRISRRVTTSTSLASSFELYLDRSRTDAVGGGGGGLRDGRYGTRTYARMHIVAGFASLKVVALQNSTKKNEIKLPTIAKV